MVQKLKLRLALKILQQSASALHHLHDVEIIHRDFRAANVLVSSRHKFSVVVTDFGLSHQVCGG